VVSDAVRVAVIGVGSIAQVAELPSLIEASARGAARVSGVVAKHLEHAERAARNFEGARSYEDVDVLLREDRPQAAFVLTPKDTHAEIVARLLDADVDVFCEKPMATSLADAANLVDRAERRGRRLNARL
jgi:virulence factor